MKPTMQSVQALAATEAPLSLPKLGSQQHHPSLRGRPGTPLCPLVLAPLRASEGELTWRIAEHYSPATALTPTAPESPSQPLPFHSLPRPPRRSLIQLAGIPNTPGQPEPARSERLGQVLSRICKDGRIPRHAAGTVRPSITGRPYKHIVSLRLHYSRIGQRRISVVGRVQLLCGLIKLSRRESQTLISSTVGAKMAA